MKVRASGFVLALAILLPVGTSDAQDVHQLVAELATEKADAARGALVSMGKPAVTALVEALPGSEPAHGWQIIRVLRELGPEAGSGKLRLQGLAKDPKAAAEARSLACLALSFQGTRASSAADVMLDLLEHEDLGLRVSAMLGLGALGEPAAKKLVKPAVGKDLFTGILAMSALLVAGDAGRVATKQLQDLCTDYAHGAADEHVYVLQRIAPLLLRRLEVEFVDPEFFAQGLDTFMADFVFEAAGWRTTTRVLRGGTLDAGLLADSTGLRKVLVDVFALPEGHPAREAALPAQLFDWNEDGKLTTGEALACLAYHLPVEMEQLARELSTELPPTWADWQSRTRGITGLIQILWLWSRPEFLDQCLCLRPLIFEGPGFEPPKLVHDFTNDVEKRAKK